MTEHASTTETKNELSREEKAFFIKAFWESLTTPQWTRDTLIELGKVVFAKVPLNKLTDEQFTVLIPKLQEIATMLGARCQPRTSPPAQAPKETT